MARHLRGATWSPDGTALVFAGRAEPLRSGHTTLWRVSADGGAPQQVAPQLDRNVMVVGPGYPGGRPFVTPTGDVVFCIRERGSVHVVAADSTGSVRVVVDGEVVVSGVAGDPLVCLLADACSTPGLYVMEADGLRRRTRTNRAFFEEVEVAVAVPRAFLAPTERRCTAG